MRGSISIGENSGAKNRFAIALGSESDARVKNQYL